MCEIGLNLMQQLIIFISVLIMHAVVMLTCGSKQKAKNTPSKESILNRDVSPKVDGKTPDRTPERTPEKTPERTPEKTPEDKLKKGNGSGENEKRRSAESGSDRKEKSGGKAKNEQKKSDDSDPRKEWAQRASKQKCIYLSKLHKEQLKGYLPPKCTYTSCEKNNALNRYSDVLCADETRVILKNHDKDYIHASWMHMPDKKTSYILTQGPIPETINDFWVMIRQEKVKFIFMLCPLSEGGVEKCARYYPDKKEETEKFGSFEITNVEQKDEPADGVLHTILRVTPADPKSEPFEVNHIFVPWWPDQLSPEDPKQIIKLYKWMKKVNPPGAPICVHCSAGVGRTATFVGIDYANLRIKENPNMELVEIVREMRGMRFQAVQTHMQFIFLQTCLLEYFTQEGIIEKDAAIQDFLEQYKKHATKKLSKRKGENEKNKKKSMDTD